MIEMNEKQPFNDAVLSYARSVLIAYNIRARVAKKMQTVEELEFLMDYVVQICGQGNYFKNKYLDLQADNYNLQMKLNKMKSINDKLNAEVESLKKEIEKI